MLLFTAAILLCAVLNQEITLSQEVKPNEKKLSEKSKHVWHSETANLQTLKGQIQVSSLQSCPYYGNNRNCMRFETFVWNQENCL